MLTGSGDGEATAADDDGPVEHERRDVVLTEVVEVLRRAGTAGGVRHLHHLLSPDVVLQACDEVVIGADAALAAMHRWLDTGADVLDVVDGGDRVAIRYERDGHRGALFLTAGDDGRLVAATVVPSAR
jgi:hypothetical protein